jgi:hypothetical protein
MNERMNEYKCPSTESRNTVQHACPAVALARSHYYAVSVRSHDTNLSCVFCCPTIMSGGAAGHTCLHTDLNKVSSVPGEWKKEGGERYKF